MKKVKIYVTGPFQAGKSSIIRRLDPESLSIDYEKREFSTTVGFDLGILFWNVDKGELLTRSEYESKFSEYVYDEVWEIVLMGTPGQKRFAPVREILAKGAAGVLLVIDSTKIGQVGVALAIYEEVRAFLGDDAPMVILANKQDMDSAADIELIRSILRINPSQLFGTSAVYGTNVKEALMSLLTMIRKREFERALKTREELSSDRPSS